MRHRELSSNEDKLLLVPTTWPSERRRLGKVGSELAAAGQLHYGQGALSSLRPSPSVQPSVHR